MQYPSVANPKISSLMPLNRFQTAIDCSKTSVAFLENYTRFKANINH